MNVSRWFGLMMAALAACGAEPVRKVDSKPAESARGFDNKPTAPVTVQLESRDLGNRRHEVTLTATATASVDDLRLTLLLPEGARVEEGSASTAFGATRQGTQRSLVRHVILASDGGDIVADVRTAESGLNRNRPLRKRLGTAAPVKSAKPTTVITLPDGQRVEEVRQ